MDEVNMKTECRTFNNCQRVKISYISYSSSFIATLIVIIVVRLLLLLVLLVFVGHLLLARLVRVLRLRLALAAHAREQVVLAKGLLSAKKGRLYRDFE